MSSIRTPFRSIAKGKEFTPLQKKILAEYYQSMGTITPREAAIKAGVNPNDVFHALRGIKNALSELAELILVQAAPKAANTVTDLMTSKEHIPQANIKLEAAKTLLDRAGVVKKEKLEIETNVTGNLFFIPSKKEIPVDVIEGVYSEDV